MAECCGLVGRHIDGLAFALTGQAVERARERRRAVRAAATRLAEATGSVRYEVLIGVFSQADYQAIFIEANKAAASFGALCLPFEIDQTVVRELCKTGAGSFDFGSQNRDPSERIVQAIRELLEEHQAAVAKMVRAMADIHGRSAAQEMCRIICRWVGASRPAGLDLLDLLEVARHLDDRAAHFEHLVTATIAQIPEHQILQDDLWYMHHTILLSLAGVLRENSQRTSCLLRTIGGIQSRRQGIGCVWVPRLSWEWLVRGTENLASHVQDIDHLQAAFEKSASIDHAEPVTGHSQQPAGVWAWTMQCLGNVDAWLHKRKVQYALKFTVAAMICAIWAFLSFSHAWYVQNNCHWAVICIAFVFNISIGATTSACLKRLLATCLAGAWAIAAWEISLKGASPPLAVLSTMMLCCACIAAQFYAGRSGLAPIAPVMLIAYAAVFCSAYYEKNNGQPGISGERLGWHRIVVNTIGIAFAMLVSAVLMPCRARVVLLERLAELLHLSSRIAQTTTFMHAAGADHPAAYRCAHSRLVHFLQRSRVLIARSRALHVTAQSEPNLAPARGIAACRQLIDLLETQLEWQMYAFSAYERIGQEAVTYAVRGSLGVRQDILGAFACFNYIVAAALASNRPLPEFLPDIRTARLQSLEIVRQALRAEPGFGATALCRLSVGVWHLAAGQSGILRLARDVVGSEADLLPDIVDRMALVMESGGDPDTTPVNSPLLATFNHPAPHPMQWFAHQHARHNLKL
ncbi:hypothetical protein EC988_001088 [Linderina pennispora]|nr:hypothetical protein EC988_001088 [Linderina pennispora]